MISESARKILNDASLIARRDAWMKKMENMFQTGEPDKIYMAGILGHAVHPDYMYTDPEKWVEEVLENLAQRARQMDTEEIMSHLSVWSTLYSNHIIDAIFGAEVFRRQDQWYNRYLQNEVGELKKPDWKNSGEWKLAKRIADHFLAQDVSLPLFAPPILGSVLNNAVNLYGQEILVAMITEPEAAMHDLQIINEVSMEMHQWYIDHIPAGQLLAASPAVRTQPPGYGHICGCSCQLVSEEMYRKMIMPLDNALLGVYPKGGMIHLCGEHRHLIPVFAEMENLKCVQLNDRAAEGLQEYVDGLREDQVIYIQTCDGMKTKQALEAAGNRRMVLTFDLDMKPGTKPAELMDPEERKKIIDFW